MVVVSHTLPLSYCLPSVLISQPPFSHHKEIVLLDPLPGLICHPAAPLLYRRTAGEEKRKQYKQAGGHNIKCSSFTSPESLLSPLFFHNHSRLICFLFVAPLTVSIFKRPTNFNLSSLLYPLTCYFVLRRTRPSHACTLNHPPPPLFTITCYNKKYCQCSQFAVTASVTSL